MFTSMGQAANYLCSEPELQELQIASETERAAWWTTSQSPPSSHTRCVWKTSPKIDKKPVFISWRLAFNCKFSFQFLQNFCVKISKLLPTKQIWKWRQQRSGQFQTWPFPFRTTLRKPWFFGMKISKKDWRVLWQQSSYVVLFLICIFWIQTQRPFGFQFASIWGFEFQAVGSQVLSGFG